MPNRTASHVEAFSDAGFTTSLGTTTVTNGEFTLADLDFSGLDTIYIRAEYDDGSEVHYSSTAAELKIYDASNISPAIACWTNASFVGAGEGIQATMSERTFSGVMGVHIPSNNTVTPIDGTVGSIHFKVSNASESTSDTYSATAPGFATDIGAGDDFFPAEYPNATISEDDPFYSAVFNNYTLPDTVALDDTVNILSLSTAWTDAEGNQTAFVTQGSIVCNMVNPGVPEISYPEGSTIFAVNTVSVTGTLPV